MPKALSSFKNSVKLIDLSVHLQRVQLFNYSYTLSIALCVFLFCFSRVYIIFLLFLCFELSNNGVTRLMAVSFVPFKFKKTKKTKNEQACESWHGNAQVMWICTQKMLFRVA
jgi:hypothetical protein